MLPQRAIADRQVVAGARRTGRAGRRSSSTRRRCCGRRADVPRCRAASRCSPYALSLEATTTTPRRCGRRGGTASRRLYVPRTFASKVADGGRGARRRRWSARRGGRRCRPRTRRAARSSDGRVLAATPRPRVTRRASPLRTSSRPRVASRGRSATTSAPSSTQRRDEPRPDDPVAPVTSTGRSRPGQVVIDHTFHGAAPSAHRSFEAGRTRASVSIGCQKPSCR